MDTLITIALMCTVIAVNCISVDYDTGVDELSCLQDNATAHCKTLEFIFTESSSLNYTEIILFGNVPLTKTLTVSGVVGLTMRGGRETASVVQCKDPSNAQGAGIYVSQSKMIKFSNIIFENCGTMQLSTTITNYNNSVKYRSAMYIINSTDIQFIRVIFNKNIGRGLSMHDVDGEIEISHCSFIQNTILLRPDNAPLFGGGGIYSEFTFCSPGYTSCNPASNTHNKNSRYQIHHCNFRNNVATRKINEQTHIVQFRTQPGSRGTNKGQGGGLHFVLKGRSFNNTISLENCTFYNNSGFYGGGIDVIFLDRASENNFNVSNCTFEQNTALNRGGGALHVGQLGTKITNNHILIRETRFYNNSAGWGGAMVSFSSRSRTSLNNSVTITETVFEDNTAPIGAAFYTKPEARQSIFEGNIDAALFHNCNFTGNKMRSHALFLKSTNGESSQYVLESGALDIESIEITFSGYVLFADNTGSAIVANSANVNISENTKVVFLNNTAVNGGAIALLGYSVLELQPQTHIIFDSNRASELGGAIYSTSPHQTEFIFSHKCFISFAGNHSKDPNKWNTTLTFVKNTATYGYAIFADSILPCVKNIGAEYINISGAFQWKSFHFIPKFEEHTIATSPSVINFTLPQEISPGEEINILPVSLDDFNHHIPIGYKTSIESIGGRGEVRANPFIADNGHLKIWGEPGSNFTLTILTQNTRHVSATHWSSLVECPIGFTLVNNSMCVCSKSLPQKHFMGLEGCDSGKFHGLLSSGYWIGCIGGNNTVTSICPFSFCNIQNTSVLSITRTCHLMAELNICTEHRRGQLCGECDEGYSVYYNSDRFQCGQCRLGALGILIFLISEIAPLIILFIVIMVVKLKITSGHLQSFLLFAQVFFLQNQLPSLRPLPESISFLLRLNTLVLGFFNLTFFHMDKLSFCLWRGATALSNVMIGYVTTLTIIILLIIFTLAVQQRARSARCSCLCIAPRFNKMTRKIRRFDDPIIHGITTFLILSYTNYTSISFLILNQVSLYDKDGMRMKSVVVLQGSVDYFGSEHLPYAIPAILVLIFLSLPPPLFLISYPLLWKIKAKLRRGNHDNSDTTIWPIRKLLPLIDSFQGVFCDECRMFAGLLFIWKMMIAAILTLTRDLNELYLLMEIALVLILAIHALVRPYKKAAHNITNILMLTNMSLLNSIKWYTSMSASANISDNIFIFLAAVQMFLLYCPVICLIGYATYCLMEKCNVVRLLQLWVQQAIQALINKDISSKPSSKSQQEEKGEEDDDLFYRAAEINHVPLTLTCEADIEFKNKL